MYIAIKAFGCFLASRQFARQVDDSQLCYSAKYGHWRLGTREADWTRDWMIHGLLDVLFPFLRPQPLVSEGWDGNGGDDLDDTDPNQDGPSGDSAEDVAASFFRRVETSVAK